MRVLFLSSRVRLQVKLGVVAVLCSTTAGAGVGVWTTTGPPPGGGAVVLVDQQNPGVLYASSSTGVTNVARPYKSVDNGATWGLVGDGSCEFLSVVPLATAPPSTVYYSGAYVTFQLNRPPFSVVAASTDGGATCGWLSPPGSFNSHTLAVDAVNRMELFVGASGGFEGPDLSGPTTPPSVSRSRDGGITWTHIEAGLPLETIDYSAILVTDPKISGTLYLATRQGLFKSVDSGAAWHSLASAAGQIAAVAIDPTNPSVLYMAPNLLQGGSGSVVKSVDGGTTFAEAGVGLQGTPVSALCVNPRNSMQVFAGTPQGVFVSLDGGASWAAMNSGLTDLSVLSLAIDPLGEYIHAGTGSGVFDFQLASPTCAKDSHTLCLNSGRFAVSASFSAALGALSVQATAVSLTNDTGYFWFFDPANVEMVVKVLTGCPVDGEYWVFAGGLTNVGAEWTVTDTLTGASKIYSNALGTPFQPVQDSSAFPCP